MGINQKLRKPLAIAIATASAFLAVPLTTSFLRAQTIENATFTVKTAGQPDRILRVISYKKYSDGESLAQVQDVATGHTFMMPGKVVEAQLKISPIKTTEIAKAVADAEAKKVTQVAPATPVAPAVPVMTPVAPVDVVKPINPVATPVSTTPVATNTNFAPTGSRYPTAIPSQFRQEPVTQEFQPGVVAPRPLTVPVNGSTAALASGTGARTGSYIANRPAVAAYAPPRPTVSDTPPVAAKPEVVVAPVPPTVVEPKVVVAPKPVEPVKVAVVTPAQTPAPAPTPVFAPQPVAVVPKVVTPNIQQASATSDTTFGHKPMTVLPSVTGNLKPHEWKQLTPAVAAVPSNSNDRWQPLASPTVQVVHKVWTPVPQSKDTCTDCWQPDSQIRPVVSIERPPAKMTLDQEVKEATQGLIYELTTSVRPTERESAASKLRECAFHARPEVRCALLRSAVGDPAPSVRAHCIDCLSSLGYDDKDYRDHLQAVSTTGPSAVRTAAKEALSKMK